PKVKSEHPPRSREGREVFLGFGAEPPRWWPRYSQTSLRGLRGFAVEVKPLPRRLFFGFLVAEQLADLVEERLRLRVRLFPRHRGELLQQLALLLVQLLRHFHRDAHVLIAAVSAVEVRDPLAAQPEHLAALRSA